MKIIYYSILFLTLSTFVSGQNSRSSNSTVDALYQLQKKELEGRVIISLDTLILENYSKHLIQNKKDKGIEGYRIRIFSDMGHGALDRQKRVRAKFLSLYPEIRTDPDYKGSYYKIYVGDFRTKRDALKILDTIKKDFPDAFIIEDNIVIEE